MTKLLCVLLTLMLCISPCLCDSAYAESAEESQLLSESTVLLTDEQVRAYWEDNVYDILSEYLNDEEYKIDYVTAYYVPLEYLEEVVFNSQKNLFFGYTLEEVHACFPDTQSIFTLGEDGTTVIEELLFYDASQSKAPEILEDVAVGLSYLMISVGISAVSGGTASSASTDILLAFGKKAAINLCSSAFISATSSKTESESSNQNDSANLGEDISNRFMVRGRNDMIFSAVTAVINQVLPQ